MKNLRTGVTAVLATTALSVGGVGIASAAHAAKPGDTGTETPCATAQTQVDKAQAKLDALTKKFTADAAVVKKDQRLVAATKGSAKGRAAKALAEAKAAESKVAKAKKAQQQRVKKAEARLEKCQAGTTPTPGTTPTTAVPTPSVSTTA